MLKKFKRSIVGFAFIAAAVMLFIQTVHARRHPHLQKTLTTKVGGVETKLTYFTAPANEEHIKNVEEGAFNSSFAKIEFSADLKVGDRTVAAGKYTVGAIKNGENDWSLALYPGQLGRGAEPDMAKVIKLDSVFSKSEGSSAHIFFDIMPGHGVQEGKATLIWHFGSYHLSGALS